MPYEPQDVQALFAQLEARLNAASKAERYRDAIAIGTALEALKAWDAAGCNSALPDSVRELDGITLPAEVAAAPLKTDERKEPASDISIPPPPGSLTPEFANELQEVRRRLRENDLTRAQAQLEVLQNLVRNDAERSALAQAERAWREQRQTALDQALRKARNTQQRGDWEAALEIEPQLAEALAALQALEHSEKVQDALQQLTAIQRRLGDIRFDITEINRARLTVEGLLADRALTEAGRRPEVEHLLQQLNDMRAAVQKASEGGTSSERSGRLEQAYAIYRNALRDGYKVISDDATGEPVEVEVAYERVRSQYFRLQVERSEEHWHAARLAISEGRPGVAVRHLEKALSLLDPVEDQSGIYLRAEVERLLQYAQQQMDHKQWADALLDEAHTAGQERQAAKYLTILMRIQSVYPDYPGIGYQIREVQGKIISAVRNDLQIGLEKAGTYLRMGKYADARKVCEQALRSGEEHTFIQADADYRAQRAKVDDLLSRIGATESHSQELQERIDAIRAALENMNVRLAWRLFDWIDAADQGDRRVEALRATLLMYSDDAAQEADARRAFDGQDFERAIYLCERLQESCSPYAEAAGRLLQRAQARLWSQEAAAAQEVGRLEEADDLTNRVLALRNLLPIEDLAYIDPLLEKGLQAAYTLQQDDFVSRFFTAAGFEVQKLDESDYLLAPGKHDRQHLGPQVYVYVKPDGTLHHSDVNPLVEAARSHYAGEIGGRTAFMILDRVSDLGARLAVYAYRLSDNFTIILLTASQLRQAIQAGDCQTALTSILGEHFSETDLYALHSPVSALMGFYGRKQVAARIDRLLERGEHVGIFGLRKMGKTSLLNYMADELPYTSAVLSLQDVNNPPDIFRSAVMEWSSALRQRIPGILLPPLLLTSSTETTDVYKAFRTDLETLLTLLEKYRIATRLLLCLDEIDEIGPVDHSTSAKIGDLREMFGFLRALATRFHAPLMVVCGLRPDVNRQARWREYNNPAFQMFHEVFLEPLSSAEHAEMVEAIGALMKVEYEKGALVHLYSASGGHPFIARQLCSMATNRERQRPHRFTVKEIDQIVQTYLRDLNAVSYIEQEMWHSVQDGAAQTLLSALGQRQPQTDAQLIPPKLPPAERLRRQRALALLVERTLVLQQDSGYCIPYDCLRRWICRTLPAPDGV